MSLTIQGDGRRTGKPETVETGEPHRGRWILEVVKEANLLAKTQEGGGWTREDEQKTEDEEAEEIRLKQMMLMDKKMASWTERDCFLFLYLCQSYPHLPSQWRQSVPMCGLYVMYIFESNIKEITMHSCKVFYSQHKLFTFRPLYALTV